MDEHNSAPPKRPKLHSPFLQGDDEDDYPPAYPEPDRNAKPVAKSKGGLRSPLLGGGDIDDDDDLPMRAPAKPAKGLPKGKGGLRSPLLGGADDEEDYEEDFPLRDKKSTSHFPHRNRAPVSDPVDLPTQTGSRPHLRSPLLEGDDDFDVPRPKQSPEHVRGQKNQGGRFGAPPASGGRPGKLHSPLFDSADSGDDYYEPDEYEEINDPNVLRSPLLAARSKLPAAPHEDPPQQARGQQPPGQGQMRPPMPQPGPASMPPQQGQGMPMQPMPGSNQLPMQQQLPQQMQQPMQSMQQPLPQPMPGQTPFPSLPGQIPPMPHAQGSGPMPSPQTQGPGSLPIMTPPNLPPLPQQPSRMPALPQPDTGYGAAAGGTAYGAGQGIPLDSAPAVMQNLGQMPGMSLGVTPTPAKPPIDEDEGWQPVVPKAKISSLEEQFPEPAKIRSVARSKVLGNDFLDDELPTKRKSLDPQPHNDVSRGVGQSGPIMVLFIPALCGMIAKGWVIMTSLQQILKSPVLLADEVSTLVVMIGIVIFAATGVKR